VIEEGYFIGMVSSIPRFLQDLNANSRCRTKHCRGHFVCTHQRQMGLGGGLEVRVACSGCGTMILYESSPRLGGRNIAAFSCMIACFLSGGLYSDYQRQFGLLFGENAFSKETYRKLVLLLHKPVENLLRKEIQVGKEVMKKKPSYQIGSWDRACTSSDGCYHVRGHFSQNMTVVIVDYLSGHVIHVCHRCAKGQKPCEEAGDNWKGTAKAAEAHATGEMFRDLKEEGMTLEVNVQDSDSSAVNQVKAAFPGCQVVICFGHHNRAFGKAPNKANSLRNSTCLRSANGCISKRMITRAKTNHLNFAKEADGDPGIYRRRMQEYGKFHVHGIHEWHEDGHCDHPLKVCCCARNCPPGFPLFLLFSLSLLLSENSKLKEKRKYLHRKT